jgi:hypothetical protein
MRRTAAVVVLLGLAVVLPGCYLSEEPLALPTGRALDDRLVGAWRCVDPENQEAALMWVAPFDASQYYVEWRDGHEPDRYRVYATEAGRHSLLNVTAIEFRPDSEWAFVGYRFDAQSRLVLSLVSDEALQGLKGEAALNAIRARVADESLYEDFAVCTPRD